MPTTKTSQFSFSNAFPHWPCKPEPLPFSILSVHVHQLFKSFSVFNLLLNDADNDDDDGDDDDDDDDDDDYEDDEDDDDDERSRFSQNFSYFAIILLTFHLKTPPYPGPI